MSARKPAHWSRALRLMEACDEAVAWARTQPDYATAWRKCERPAWMLWLVSKVKPNHKALRPLAYAFADRAVRVHAVTALRGVGRKEEANRLSSLPEIVDRETSLLARQAAPDLSNAAFSAYAAASAAAATYSDCAAACDAAYAADAAYVAASAYAAYVAASAAERRWQANLIRKRIRRPALKGATK